MSKEEIARVSTDLVSPGAMMKIKHPPYTVLLANVDGEYHAIEDACPHSGWSLSEGSISGHHVTCPGHGWVVDIRDGRTVTPGHVEDRNPVFVVRVENGQVIVLPPSR